MKYKSLVVEDTGSPATEKDIEALEKILGTALPNDYVQFLKTCNGAYLAYDTPVEFKDGSSEYLCFCELYSVSNELEWSSNPFELKQEREHGSAPANLLPIARDGGDSRLFLDLKHDCKVVAFVQGLPAWTKLRQQDAWIVIAESFDSYLAKLTLSDQTIADHIKNFNVTEQSVEATLEWLDSIGQQWRTDHQASWNKRVPFHQI
ncbi:SMI1/KNR4 family protein [Alteromonas sp. C1M14]|uniref:SMI1/KNR4 family protein n=1 Tax=Alteromonas sp. C1M14 TaxID=2841567 RepID=UPI001C08F86E|nr:SMI1/KNR4 family protein [Alteromonas sp. C1M14]MBU2978736.1 SMI1/KNR4 family protein [Alteromonas sp. C1M14]